MKQSFPLLAFLLLLSIFLGGASVWPLSDAGDAGVALWRSGFLFAALAIFVVLLPRWKGLPVQIFVAMVAGVAAGWVLSKAGEGVLVTDYLGVFGKLFILLLKVVIVPLIFVSVLCGVAGIGDVRKLGRLGAKTIGYYFLTTAIAVIIGLSLVNMIRPGSGRDQLQRPEAAMESSDHTAAPTVMRVLVLSGLLGSEEAQSLLTEYFTADTADEGPLNVGQRIQQHVLPAVIQNPIMSGQNPIVIIFFAILLGAALAVLGETGEPALAVFRALDRAFITIVLWVMVLAPIGVFALMAGAIAQLGLDYVLTLAKYCFTVFLGLGLHFFVLCFLICPLIGGISPMRFLRGMTPAFEVSFSTSSSSATLPVTIECASKRVGADPNVASFMLPIGATINMDGTALYLSVASLFIAQVYGIDLSLQAQIMVFLTAVLASVGTAGIPGASIGLMSIILASAGIPVEGIGIVVGVDRILDMTRTVVNITGDSVGAVVVSRTEGLLRDPQ